jgi:hypothetical protein
MDPYVVGEEYSKLSLRLQRNVSREDERCLLFNRRKTERCGGLLLLL